MFGDRLNLARRCSGGAALVEVENTPNDPACQTRPPGGNAGPDERLG